MHPYLRIYYKNFKSEFTDYYNFFIKNKKKTNTKKKYNGNKSIKQIGGVIYGNGKYKFNFKIDKNNYETRIFIGDKINCFLGLIYNDNPNIVIIQGFNFDKSCNIDENMIEGKDTKIMFNTILKFIKDKYKLINKVELTDEAELNCFSNIINDTISINLYYLYHLKYGKGYYLQNFGFKIDNSLGDINRHKNNIKKYLKYNLVYNEFKKFIIDEVNIEHRRYILSELNNFFSINIDNNGKIEKLKKMNYKLISKKLKNIKYDCYFLDLLITFIKIKAEFIDLKKSSYYLEFK